MPLVLVTGATGFVAPFVIAGLLDAGYRVRAACRSEPTTSFGNDVELRRLGGMMDDIDAVRLLADVAYVVHLAGLAHSSAAIPETLYNAANIELARALAAAAGRAGVRRFLLMSSVRAQCGPIADTVVTERDAPAPTDAYARSKLAGEDAVADALSETATDWCVLRPVLVYGAGVKGNMRTLFKLARLPIPLPFGGLEGRRSLISGTTLALAVRHALVSPNVSRQRFLIAEDEPLTVPEIIAGLRAGQARVPGIIPMSGRTFVRLLTLLGREGAAQQLTGNLIVDAGAFKATGWRPAGTIRDGLAQAMRDDLARQADDAH